MNELSLFNSPMFLGFDHFEDLFNGLAKAEDSYPPYNIEQVGEEGFRITLALAGFKESDLNISTSENKLVIKGKQEEVDHKVYLHRGLATRRFVKTFVLADNVEVKKAIFDNGLLHIDLLRKKNTETAKVIPIESPNMIKSEQKC